MTSTSHRSRFERLRRSKPPREKDQNRSAGEARSSQEDRALVSERVAAVAAALSLRPRGLR